jgi:A/G-specific adenine glycosylase
MLQQTRVETVIPYFEAWMRRFPDLASLAAADEQKVLKAWEGLGYYTRARNLHRAAKRIVSENGGELPREADELRLLPGIGRYTAAAIASIAFDRDEVALDGNIRRVYARLFDVEQFVDSALGLKTINRLAQEHLPRGRAAAYNQALMDLGAAICLPKNPHCKICPLVSECRAARMGTQGIRPALKPKKRIPHQLRAAGVIEKRGRVLLARRPQSGLLGGLWEFPNVPVAGNPGRGLGRALYREYGLKVERPEVLDVISHAYSHFKVTVHAFRCELVSMSGSSRLRWLRRSELNAYPMGKVDRRIAGMLNHVRR